MVDLRNGNNTMNNPNETMRFIEKNDLGYILGNAVKSIILAKDITLEESKRLQHLKDARRFLNFEIKRLSIKEKIK